MRGPGVPGAVVYETFREVDADPERGFAALEDPSRIARWWGPDGFTNTVRALEVRPGGRYVVTMRGPDGADRPNEYAILAVERPRRVVFHHGPPHEFWGTATLEPLPEGRTRLGWRQEFADPDEGRRVEGLVVPANAQLLARWAAEARRVG